MLKMETKINWEDVGFRCGLEIHQELSGNKLFCYCSTDLREQNKLFEIKRKLRPSEGEIGEKDLASLFEEQRNREFIYYGYKNEACLMDTDDEPPHPINQKALKTSLEVALLLKLKIPDELIVMRKTITNGSCISGFQRTLVVGLGTEQSYIETSQGRIRIKDLYLEEDSAKIIKTEENKVYYSLSRSGIPLIELGTKADIKTPKQALEAAQSIGTILRSCNGIKHGIGTIRQDINISIKNHSRIELKGFQDLKSMPMVIETEVLRQLKNKNEDSHVRKVEPDFTSSYLRPMPGSTRLYPETDIPHIPITSQLIKSTEIPELITERALNFERKYNIQSHYTREIIKENVPFDYYAEKYKIDPKFIAHLLIEIPKELRSRFNIKDDPKKEHFDFILGNIEKNKIPKEATIEILKELITGIKPDISKYSIVSLAELEGFIKNLVEENKGVSISGLMGDIMKKYRGKVDGSLVMKFLKKYYEESNNDS